MISLGDRRYFLVQVYRADVLHSLLASGVLHCLQLQYLLEQTLTFLSCLQRRDKHELGGILCDICVILL